MALQDIGQITGKLDKSELNADRKKEERKYVRRQLRGKSQQEIQHTDNVSP